MSPDNDNNPQPATNPEITGITMPKPEDIPMPTDDINEVVCEGCGG